MSLRIVGAGLGRTGTLSLKVALEELLGGRCYHMQDVMAHPDHIERWEAAAGGEPTDWEDLLGGYVATVDWPAAAFWDDLAAANPDALVLLSTRASAEEWWRSASATIFDRVRPVEETGLSPFVAMFDAVAARTFTPAFLEEAPAKEAYERHNAHVRAAVPAERLVVWQPGDGWAPLCTALGVPEPDKPFPHVNDTSQFRARMGLD